MRLCSIASGSSGNCIYVGTDTTHVLVDSNPAFEEPSMILLEQIFTIDKSRIERFMGYASKAEMLRIDMALLVSLALNVLSGNRSE